MPLVKVDQKMRIRLPKKISERLKLKGREIMELEVQGDVIRLTKPKEVGAINDAMLRDMIEHPLHTKKRITSEILNKIEEEMWYP